MNLLVAFLSIALSAGGAADAGTRRIVAGGSSDAGGRVADFRQREPRDGEPASVRTVADVRFDEQNLYVTFVCDEEPGTVRAHLSRRDDIAGDDYVSVALDTFHDGRHAYVFKANPLGVQRDGIITEGQDDDYSFDAVWESDGHLTPTGYVVRFAIPFRSLRYENRDPIRWGIALTRFVPARSELVTWPHLSSAVDAYVPQFATLDGLTGLPSGDFVTLTPYAFAAAERSVEPSAATPSSNVDRRVGADAKVVIGRAWTIDLTMRPDFSQVESDEPQVTSNQRYAVYFPERRPFFTDRASFFNTPESIFFSRRVVDPLAGARVTGVAGRWTLGGLLVGDAAHGGETADNAALVGATRAQRAFRTDSSVGVAAALTQSNGGDSSEVVSADARVRLTPNWTATLQAAQSGSSSRDAARRGGALLYGEVRHEGRNFKYHTTYRDRSPDFDAPLGFITRTDVRQIENGVAYYIRRLSGPVLNVIPSATAVADWDYAGRLQDASIDLPLWFDFKGPVSTAVGYTRAAENYRGIAFMRDAAYVAAYGDVRRWLGFNLFFRRGSGINYYPAAGRAPSLGGERYDLVEVTVRPSQRVRVSESYVSSRLEQPFPASEMLADRYLRVKASVQVSRALSVRAILDRHALDVDRRVARDEPERGYAVDILLTYLVTPGSALYVGFTDRVQEAFAQPAPTSLSAANRQLFVKLSKSLRF